MDEKELQEVNEVTTNDIDIPLSPADPLAEGIVVSDLD